MPFGLKKFIGGREKFIGKTFVPERFMEDVDGHEIHYREDDYRNLFAWKLDDAFCIDEDAWLFCEGIGVAFLVAWIRDKEAIAIVDAEIVSASPVLAMGEGRQYRVPIKKVQFWKKKNGAYRPPNIPFIDDEDCIDLELWRNGHYDEVAADQLQ